MKAVTVPVMPVIGSDLTEGMTRAEVWITYWSVLAQSRQECLNLAALFLELADSRPEAVA